MPCCKVYWGFFHFVHGHKKTFSFLNSKGQVSHPYKITVLHILIFTFLGSIWTTQDSGLNGFRHFLNFVLISSSMQSFFVTVVPKYIYSATFSKDLLAVFIILSCIMFTRQEHICSWLSILF